MGDLRPLKAKVARISGLEIELAQYERVIQDLQERLAHTQSSGDGGRSGPRGGASASVSGSGDAVSKAAAPEEAISSRMRALEAEVKHS